MPGIDAINAENESETLNNSINNYIELESKTENGMKSGCHNKGRKNTRNKYIKQSWANNKSMEDRPSQKINNRVVLENKNRKQSSHSNYVVS